MEFNETDGPASTPSCRTLQKHFEYLHKSQESVSDGHPANDVANSVRILQSQNSSNRSSNTRVEQQIIEEDVVVERPLELNERFVNVLDHLDAHVEKFRKDALQLQEKRDYLLMSIDLIKSNDLLIAMSESELDEINTYIQRVNARLGTVELKVRTVRDTSQEDSLSQVNALIDMMITMGDPVYSRQRCQQYLNACCSSSETAGGVGKRFSKEFSSIRENFSSSRVVGGNETDLGPVDKKFESALLGCTLDDQKNIKKRLQALMDYLNKQTISHTVEANTSKQSIIYKTSSHSQMAQSFNKC